MKRKNDSEWDQDRKLKRIVKGTNKVDKHRKSIYNMLSEEEDDSDFDDYYDVDYENDESFSHKKQR